MSFYIFSANAATPFDEIPDTSRQDAIIETENIQEKTISKEAPSHSPARAAFLSAVLPGAGQVYNRKYWKLPIIYAGFAGLGYSIYFNAGEYRNFRNAILTRLDDNPDTTDPYEDIYTTENLITLKNYYRRNLDISVVASILLYALNIIDATVDAHLFEFDVSDDLSLQLFNYDAVSQPYFTGFQNGSVNFTLRWKVGN
ncbi:MAG: hypothetical protein EA412_12140 [Chitinophagaceae bacterium]|nr:MAG: hypothetical protein EA412_12140 [Chitinophagaceae bacterium]